MSGAPERVTVISPLLPPGLRWQPRIGEETLNLFKVSLGHLSSADAEAVRRDALEILGRCLPPSETAGSETGLIVGYVQSGKTMSFTTVTALARDNDYHLVIVVAGTSIPLLNQSADRLAKDLRLNSRMDRKWQALNTENWSPQDASALRARLLEWKSERYPANERRTVLITVMKNHGHLKKVIDALEGLDMSGVRALIVDDEADQASLNTQVLQERQSTTYQRLLALRRCLPHHSFLQYTATPQATLLINIIDVLSPRFVKLLSAGPAYVGGKDFFIDRKDLTAEIPDFDIPSESNDVCAAPESLLKAMRIFFLGVAAGRILDGGQGNRSMMVHPTQLVVGHRVYYRWVTAARETWEAALEPGADPVLREELLAAFKGEYPALASAVPNLPEWPQLADRLYDAILATKVIEVNATNRGKTPRINWRDEYSHILVGGQAMDRGFTVEGLTVTYMPRSLGVGNADTVQQRARFFGYKRGYLGFCRVFLPRPSLTAYTDYVRHEEDLRLRLQEFVEAGRPLSEWKRVFHLDPKFKPCRDSVLDLENVRTGAASEWHVVQQPHIDPEAVRENRAVVNAFVERREWREDDGSPKRTSITRHNEAIAPLSEILDELLTRLKAPYFPDSQRLTTLTLLLKNRLERGRDMQCVVLHMSKGEPRDRAVNKKGNIDYLFQGAVSGRPRELQGLVYGGDQAIAEARDTIVVQLHNLNVLPAARAKARLAEGVPCIAVYVPAGVTESLLAQTDQKRTPRARRSRKGA